MIDTLIIIFIVCGILVVFSFCFTLIMRIIMVVVVFIVYAVQFIKDKLSNG
jgi:hypothetical protein